MKEEAKGMVQERDAKQVGRNWDNKEFHGQQDPEEQRGVMLSGLRLLSEMGPVIRHLNLANEGYVKRL